MKNVLKFLNKPLIGGILKSLPFGIGSIAQNVLSPVNGVGSLDKKELPAQLFKIALYAILVYMVVNGKLSWDDAESAKELIGD